MKAVILFLISLTFSVSLFAQSVNQCGGTCEGTSENRFYNAACDGASVNGQRACERYAGMGCVWSPRRLIPGRCVGTGGNRFYDSACVGASVNGQRACERYSGLGCVWEPAFCR